MVNKIFPVLLFISLVLKGNSQPNIKISDEIKVIENKTYYVHTVEQNQTLYSISKAYQISINEIQQINQLSSSSIKPGQKLLIPKNENHQNKEEYIYHTVENGETLYGLSQQYDISIENIIKMNPEARNGIKKGQLLKILNNHFSEINGENETEYIFVTVEKDNTLYSISKYYGITINEIILLNPQTKVGLKEGETIKLPKNKINPNLIVNNQIIDTVNQSFEHLYFEEEGITPCKDFMYKSEMTFNVVMMLPLNLEENLHFLEKYKDQKDQMFYKNTQRFIELYEGALIALNKLKSEGFSVNLKVIDTKNDEQVIENYLSKCNFKKIDLIIGPVYSKNIKIVSKYAQEHRINLISPLSTEKELIDNNPFVFQVMPSLETMLGNAAETINNGSDSSIVFIHTGTEDEIKYVKLFTDKLSKNDSLKTFKPTIKSVNFKDGGSKTVESALIQGITNTIILSSVDEVFVSQILDILERLSKTHKIKLIVSQKAENLQNTSFNHLSKLNVHYISPTFIDYSSEGVQKFINDYRSVYHTEPSVFSFEGYDIIYYFMNALRKYGKHFQFCLNENENLPEINGLILNYHFKRTDENGGFENVDSFTLKYNEAFRLVIPK